VHGSTVFTEMICSNRFQLRKSTAINMPYCYMGSKCLFRCFYYAC